MPSNVKLLAGASGGEPTDANFKNVTLLLHGDGSNGAQNNTFIDSSTNNFTITRNGNTTQGSFSPYGSNWSNYFNGGIDRLQVPVTSNMYLGTTYTIEAWAYYASSSYGARPIFSQCEAFQGGFAGLTLTLNTSGQLVAEYRPATSGTVTTITGPTVTPNTWFHIALVSDNSSAKLYVNGIQVGSTTTFGDYPSAKTAFVAVGSWGHGWNDTGIPAAAWIGYISNMRVVKGSAVYTSNFTPSTTPLTAISGTVLLTCQSNRFIDNSSVNNTLTPNGSPKVTNFAPFAPSSAYSTTTNGGSAYFDGSGDYLAMPSNAAFGLGSGDFTVECWVNPSVQGGHGSSNNDCIIDFRPGSNGAYGTLYIVNNGSGVNWYANTAVQITGGPIPNNAWTHLAVSRVSGNTRLFINGVQSGGTYSDGTTYATTNPWIGQFNDGAGSGWFQGYISNFRILKGTGLYSGSFTPPAAPLTAVTNTQFLLNATNAAIFDNSMKNDLETVGNAQISTSVKKFGTGSMSFDGSGDRIAMPGTPDHLFGSGNFTVEFWINTTQTTSNATLINKEWVGSPWTGGWTIQLNGNSNSAMTIYWADYSSASAFMVADTTLYRDGNWHHVAWVRNGSSFNLYIDGVSRASASNSSSFGVNLNALTIGDDQTFGPRGYNGYMDDLRITKGVARYTANFTPPVKAFENS